MTEPAHAADYFAAVADFRKLCHIESYAPTDNVAELTARVNDDGWDTSYVHWLELSRLGADDALLVFSVGGGSREHGISVNLVNAIERAADLGAAVYGIVSAPGGTLGELATIAVLIDAPPALKTRWSSPSKPKTPHGPANGSTSPRRSTPVTTVRCSAASTTPTTRGPRSRRSTPGRPTPPCARGSAHEPPDGPGHRRFDGDRRAVAERLAVDGARVVLVARGQDALDEALAALEGDGHVAHALDVTDAAGWERVTAGLGELHGLVTAAGVLDPIGPIGSYDPAAFVRTLDINVVGVLRAVHHCLPALRRAGGRGAIVTFSGGGGTAPLRRYDAYAASKAAFVRLTENLAVELASEGLLVNAVAPGFVATRMHASTLAAGPEIVGPDYFARTRRELETGGAPVTEAAELVRLLLDPATEPFTGKLGSAQWDPWRDAAFRARLVAEPDLATLRRIDAPFYAAVERG